MSLMREQLDSRKRKSHSMTDQYKKETAQIHAPAALLEKTKAAVRAEEERIRKEQTARVPIPVSGLQVSYADYVAYQKKSSLRKWTYPLTAAAAVVILFSISMAMKGIGDSAGDRMADGAMMAEESTAAKDETFAGMPEEMDYGEAADSTAGEVNANAAQTDSMAEAAPEEIESSEEAAEAPSADFAEGDIRKQMEQDSMKKENEAEKGDLAREDSQADTAGSVEDKSAEEYQYVIDGSMKIIEVDEKPAFSHYAGARDVVYEGETYRVIEQKQGWGAYVETEEGRAYVICGQAESEEDFLQEVYEAMYEIKKSH